MSSIQDRIRRLQSAEDDATRPASGAVEAAKARLTRGGSASGPGSVSNIASRFTAAADAEEKPHGPSVAALRDRVATSGTTSTVQARAAALAGSKEELSSTCVSARRNALETTPSSGSAVSERAGRLERTNLGVSTKAPGTFSAKTSVFERIAEPVPLDTPGATPVTGPVAKSKLLERGKSDLDRAKSDKQPVQPNSLSARASLFEQSAKPTPADIPAPAPVSATPLVPKSKVLDRAKSDKAPMQPSALSARASLFEQRATPTGPPQSAAMSAPKSKILGMESKASEQSTRPTSLSARASVFEENKGSESSRVAALRAAPAPPAANLATGRVAVVKASLTRAPPTAGPPSTAAASGKAGPPKDKEVEGLRAELAEMVMVSKELLKELATLRAGMHEMESTRDALQKRIQELERQAK